MGAGSSGIDGRGADGLGAETLIVVAGRTVDGKEAGPNAQPAATSTMSADVVRAIKLWASL